MVWEVGEFPNESGRGVTLLDKSAVVRKKDPPITVSENVLEVNISMIMKMGFSRRLIILERMKSDVVGMLISHLCDFIIAGADSFIAYIHGRLENGYGAGVPDGNE